MNAKGKDGVLEQTPLGRERRQLHLPISLGQVQGGEVSGRSKSFNQLVDPGHGVGVEVGHLVQPSEVITEPVTPVRFRHQDDRTGPGAAGLLNDSELQHPDDLLDRHPSGLRDPVGRNSHLHSWGRPDVVMDDRRPPRELGEDILVLQDQVVEVLLLGPG